MPTATVQHIILIGDRTVKNIKYYDFSCFSSSSTFSVLTTLICPSQHRQNNPFQRWTSIIGTSTINKNKHVKKTAGITTNNWDTVFTNASKCISHITNSTNKIADADFYPQYPWPLQYTCLYSVSSTYNSLGSQVQRQS
jgi:hypothetical protein